MTESKLEQIANCDRADRIGDVIFVHGLGGDSRGTWHPEGDKNDRESWLFWLGQDLPEVGIWSIDYEVEPSAWKGNTMPLTDRATNILALLDSHDLGDRPIIFVTHSLGGLLVKQMFRTARDQKQKGWRDIVGQTRGLVFLATPHSGASFANWISSFGTVLRKTVSVDELKANSPQLLELNLWFRNNFRDLGINVKIYYEKYLMSGVLVVDASSADPGIENIIPIPLDNNHITICQPRSKDALIYRSLKKFIGEWFSTQSSTCLESPEKDRAKSNPATTDKVDIDALVQDLRQAGTDKIIKEIGMMRLLGVNHLVPVDEIYVDLTVLDRPSSDLSHEELQATLKSYSDHQNISFTFNRLGLGNVVQNPQPALDILKNRHKVMLLGKPGAGKTTLLRSLAVHCIKGETHWEELQSYVPIFINLRNFAEDIRFDQKFDIFQKIQTEIQSWSKEKPQAVEALLDAGRVLLLLDGLDEVPDQEWKVVLRQIRLFCDKNWKNRIVVSCRTQQLKYRFDSSLVDVEIADFNPKQVERFILNWFEITHRKEQAISQTKNLLSQLQQNKAIADLVVTPVLLNLICKVSPISGELPQKKTDLYKKCILHLLKERDEENNIERENLSGLTIEQKEDLLSGIAYNLFEQDNYLPTQEKLAKLISEKLDIRESKSGKIMKSFESEHGLLIERFEKVWSFSHLTFHEYFAAREIIIVQNFSEELRNSMCHKISKRWLEVFLIAAEMSSNTNNFLLEMKQVIDSMLLEDLMIQKFLAWVKEKACSVGSTYKLSAVRAFYIDLALDLDLSIAINLDGDLARDISINHNLSFLSIDRDLARDFALISDFALAREFDIGDFRLSLEGAINHSLNINIDLSDRDLARDLNSPLNIALARDFVLTRAIDLAYKIDEKQFLQNLQALKDQLPVSSASREICKTWVKQNGEHWLKDYRQTLIKHHNICQDWKFNDEQQKLLRQYYIANKLIVDCLNNKCYVSREVHQHIVETLLLPFIAIPSLSA